MWRRTLGNHFLKGLGHLINPPIVMLLRPFGDFSRYDFTGPFLILLLIGYRIYKMQAQTAIEEKTPEDQHREDVVEYGQMMNRNNRYAGSAPIIEGLLWVIAVLLTVQGFIFLK